MSNAVSANILRPAFPTREELLKSSLLVKNEGSRALQIIGDLITEGERILPGNSFEIDIAQFQGAVRLTFYEGGIQVDCAGESAPSPDAHAVLPGESA